MLFYDPCYVLFNKKFEFDILQLFFSTENNERKQARYYCKEWHGQKSGSSWGGDIWPSSMLGIGLGTSKCLSQKIGQLCKVSGWL